MLLYGNQPNKDGIMPENKFSGVKLLIESSYLVRVIIYFTISNSANSVNHKKRVLELRPIQVVLAKCDLCIQDDLARRVVQVRKQLSDILRCEPRSLPFMLVSAKAGLGYNNIRAGISKGGVM